MTGDHIRSPLHHMHNIFFDLDGTLHKEDIFLAFILFLAKKRILNTLIFLPLLLQAGTLHLFFANGKLGINLALFCLTFGMNPAKQQQLIAEFSQHFQLTPFANVREKLQQHLANQQPIFLISGSPAELIRPLYSALLANDNVQLISSQFTHRAYAMWLRERCYAENKAIMLDRRFTPRITFEIGYSDSLSDKAILDRCQQAILIDKKGEMREFQR